MELIRTWQMKTSMIFYSHLAGMCALQITLSALQIIVFIIMIMIVIIVASSQRLGLEAVSRPIKAAVSVSSRTEWQAPRSRPLNQGSRPRNHRSRSWSKTWSHTVRARLYMEQLGLVHKSLFAQMLYFFYTKCPNVASALSSFRTAFPLQANSIHLTNTHSF